MDSKNFKKTQTKFILNLLSDSSLKFVKPRIKNFPKTIRQDNRLQKTTDFVENKNFFEPPNKNDAISQKIVINKFKKIYKR